MSINCFFPYEKYEFGRFVTNHKSLTGNDYDTALDSHFVGADVHLRFKESVSKAKRLMLVSVVINIYLILHVIVKAPIDILCYHFHIALLATMFLFFYDFIIISHTRHKAKLIFKKIKFTVFIGNIILQIKRPLKVEI